MSRVALMYRPRRAEVVVISGYFPHTLTHEVTIATVLVDIFFLLRVNFSIGNGVWVLLVINDLNGSSSGVIVSDILNS